jgi:hypothetical protein
LGRRFGGQLASAMLWWRDGRAMGRLARGAFEGLPMAWGVSFVLPQRRSGLEGAGALRATKLSFSLGWKPFSLG